MQIFFINENMNININSEIGKLEGVILHSMGQEIENMNPQNAERALYSDILNLAVAKKEYEQFERVLEKHTTVFKINTLLSDILKNEKVKSDLVKNICKNENIPEIEDELLNTNNIELARLLIEGVEIRKNSLTNFMNKQRFALQPLHNFFFTRDASVSIGNRVFISKMASKIREREALIMEAIFDYNPNFSTKSINPLKYKNDSDQITIEGGDILIARHDILLIGLSGRTTTQGIDFIIDRIKEFSNKHHIIVQELPDSPESFIHLDMVFTFLDKDKAMVYEPVIFRKNKFQTVHICIDNGKVVSIKNVDNIIVALKGLGMDLETVKCGGENDIWVQEREQWHSGANFFAMAPGKIIGYNRNVYTIEALNKNGFEVLKATDIIKNKIDIANYEKYVVTIEGTELARGGGGARCMTMPVSREDIK